MLFCLLTMVVLSGCLAKHEVPDPEPSVREAKIILRLRAAAITRSYQSRLLPAQEADVNDVCLYFFHSTLPEASRHIYVDSPGKSIELSLPNGDYELFALGNIGSDPGNLTREQAENYICRIRSENDLNALPMSFRQNIHVENGADIPVLLERACARVDLNVSIDPSCPEGLAIHSISLRNVAGNLAMFSDNRPPAEELLSPYATVSVSDNRVPARTFYLPENLRGTNPAIADQKYRNMANAPSGSTYIQIYGTFAGVNITYYIFLGSNTTGDFNIHRNRHYTVNVNILGVDNDDLRVSMTSLMLVQGPAAHYDCSQTATMTLSPFCTNYPDAPLWLSYSLAEGAGRMTLDGTDFPAGTKRSVTSDALLEVGYTQDEAGPARILFMLTDAAANAVTNEVSTEFKNANPLSVLYTTSKTGMIATVDFTVYEPAYTDRFYIDYRNVSGAADVNINGSKIVSGGSGSTDNCKLPGVHCPIDITPSRDFVGRFTIRDRKENSRIFEISISVGAKTIDVREVTV